VNGAVNHIGGYLYFQVARGSSCRSDITQQLRVAQLVVYARAVYTIHSSICNIIELPNPPISFFIANFSLFRVRQDLDVGFQRQTAMCIPQMKAEEM
jgi:hypothetical protein